jgi:flagellar motor switch protein FliN
MNQDETAALVTAQNSDASVNGSNASTGVGEAIATEFADVDAPSLGNTDAHMSSLMDLTLPVAIELGRTTMTVQEILQLGRGSVVQLERLAGEPIDIYVGERRFAEGEVVVLGENFGVRVTRILSRAAGPELIG